MRAFEKQYICENFISPLTDHFSSGIRVAGHRLYARVRVHGYLSKELALTSRDVSTTYLDNRIFVFDSYYATKGLIARRENLNILQDHNLMFHGCPVVFH